MNPETTPTERQRHVLFGELTAVHAILMEMLDHHPSEAAAKAHIERALVHVREAGVAVHEPDRARSVGQLSEDLEKIRHLFEEYRKSPPPSTT